MSALEHAEQAYLKAMRVDDEEAMTYLLNAMGWVLQAIKELQAK